MANIATTLTSNLEYALHYASLGWGVFPAHTIQKGACSCGKPNCGSPGKHPRTRNGLKDATTNPRAILRWWNQYPDANIAIRTGKESNLVVLDIDTKSNGFESLETLENTFEALPNTLTAITGGKGKHICFFHPGVAVRNRTNLVAGIDFRGENGYIIAAPSAHVSGNAYTWVNLESALSKPPAWLTEIINHQVKGVNASTEESIPEGRRNSTLMSIAGTKRSQGEARQKLKTSLLEENQLRCRPPLDHDEVLKIVDSVCTYEKGKTIFKYTWINRVLGSGLKSSSKLLLLVLSCHMNSDGRSCYPTQEQLVSETSMDIKTIRRHTGKCIDAGYIQQYLHKTDNQKYWNYGYIATLPE